MTLLPAILLLTVISLTGSLWQVGEPELPCLNAGAIGEPLRIGMVFPPAFQLGGGSADASRGVQIMTETINACGGINGRPLELVHEEASNYNSAVVAAERLTDTVPLVIGSGSSAIHQALAEASTQGSFVLWEVTQPIVDAEPNVFSARPSGIQLGDAAAEFSLSEITSFLGGELPRVALITEDFPVANAIADGVRTALAAQNITPLISERLGENNRRFTPMAYQARDMGVNVMITAMSSTLLNNFWNAMRQADANPVSWLHISADNPQIPDLLPCGVISVSATGEATMMNVAFQNPPNPLFAIYLAYYEDQFGELPSPRANLAASSVAILSQILADALLEDNVTPTSAEIANILATHELADAGLIGEGWRYDEITGFNNQTEVMISQVQTDGLCTIAPDTLTTCASPVQPLTTWRDRARGADVCSSS